MKQLSASERGLTPIYWSKMQSYKDIYLAVGLLILSATGSWASFSALKKVDKPLATYITPFHTGNTHYLLKHGEQCVGEIHTQIVEEQILLRAYSWFSNRGESKRTTVDMAMQLDKSGNMSESKTTLSSGGRQLDIMSKGLRSIEFSFELVSPSGKTIKYFSLPGPLTVYHSPDSQIELQHPYISRTLRFIEKTLANHFGSTLSLERVPDKNYETTNATQPVCRAPEKNALEVSEIVEQVTALTQAWSSLTAGRKTDD